MARMKPKTPDSPKPTAEVIPLPISKNEKRRAEDKWSPQIMKHGYTLVPNLLIRAQGKLKMQPDHFDVLVQIMAHWWVADEKPYPSKELIARRIGRSPRQVQRYLGEMEDEGFIERHKRTTGKNRQASNHYSFNGLIAKLKEVEPEFAKEAEQRKIKAKKLETAKAS